jgi:hypothetical protein
MKKRPTMKNPTAVAFACLAFIASTGFGQMPSSGPGQMAGGSARFGPDGQLISGTATFNVPSFPAATVTGAPYSADEISEQTQTLSDGTRVTHSMPTIRVYRDSVGRTRTERPALAMGPRMKPTQANLPIIPEIYDPVAGYQYILDTANRVAHRCVISQSARIQSPPPIAVTGVPVGARVFRSEGNPQAGLPAISSEPLGTQMIEGVLAEGRRMTMTYPADAMGNDRPVVVTTENWTSLDLKTTVLTRSIDPRSGESIRALANISRAEPDPRLFQIPPDYKIVDETGPFTITFTGSK